MTSGISTAVLAAIHEGVDQLGELSERLSRDRKAIVKAVQVLKSRDLVQIVSADQSRAVCETAPTRYVLTEAGRERASSGLPISPGQGIRPRKQTAGLRKCAWWDLRAFGVTSLVQILLGHADGTERDAESNLYKWLCALERATILARQGQRLPARQSRGRVQWRLVLDLGLEPPVWRQKANEVYDPNSGKVFPMRPARTRAQAVAEAGEAAEGTVAGDE